MNAKKRQERLATIQKVLMWTFFMNFSVCAIKIVLGLLTGMITIVADGLHSLGDSLSNIIGYFGIRLARKEPDEKYAYGYDKFESIATLLIVAVLAVSCYKVFEGGIERLMKPQPSEIHPLVLGMMLFSMVINAVTVWYESGAGKRLKSELLIADASETRSDLWVSGGVLIGVVVIRATGWWWADGLMALVVGVFIFKVIVEIVLRTAKMLADAQVVAPTEVEKVVLAVPGAAFCHAVRSRGREEGFYLDLHLGVAKETPIETAHDDVCHRVKVALHEAFPGLKAANIHIEPDNDSAKARAKSVFRSTDPYDHG